MLNKQACKHIPVPISEDMFLSMHEDIHGITETQMGVPIVCNLSSFCQYQSSSSSSVNLYWKIYFLLLQFSLLEVLCHSEAQKRLILLGK